MINKDGQLELDFSSIPTTYPTKIGGNKTTIIRGKVQKITEKITNKDIFIEDLMINGMPYEFKISHRIKGEPYMYSTENDRVSNIIFLLKQGEDKGHKFQIYISSYRIKEGRIEKIKFSSICKIDPRNGGACYADRNGFPIQHFNYFKRLFSGTGAHEPIEKILEKAIREIHIRESIVL